MTKHQSGKPQSLLTISHSRLGTKVSLAFIALAALGNSPASAGIKCQNGYQIVAGSHLATPYCQDMLLARVAREYGSKVSAKTIRNNPMKKRDVCRLIGHDIRVQSNCFTVLPRRGGRF